MGYDYEIDGQIKFSGKIKEKKTFMEKFEDPSISYDKDTNVTTINFVMSWHTGGGSSGSCSENSVKFLKKNNIADGSGIITEYCADSEFTQINIIKGSEIVQTYSMFDLIKLLEEKHNI